MDSIRILHILKIHQTSLRFGDLNSKKDNKPETVSEK